MPAWSSFANRRRRSAVGHDTRWYRALAPNIDATLPANTAADTTARAPDALITSAAPAPIEAKNAHSWLTPRNVGRRSAWCTFTRGLWQPRRFRACVQDWPRGDA